MTAKRARKFKHVIFALIPLAVLFAAAEFFARRYVKNLPYHRGLIQLRGKNVAYTSKPWFSETFLASSLTQPGGHYSPKGTTLILPNDYQDEFYSVHRGIRQTTGSRWKPEEGPPIPMVIIGGSTAYCSEVPDRFTFPSQLQSLLAGDSRTRSVVVENYGVTTVHSKQEVERLFWEVERGHVPRVAVFYDGVNDVVQGIYNAAPNENIAETQRRHQSALPFRLSEYSSLFEIAYFGKWGRTPPWLAPVPPPAHLNDQSRLEAMARQMADEYEKNMLRAKALCDRLQIRMYLMLQGCISTIKSRPLTDHEKSVIEQGFPGIQAAFDAGYPLLRLKLNALRTKGVRALDLSNTFEAYTKPIFLDFCHVESDGNELVARRVYECLMETPDWLSAPPGPLTVAAPPAPEIGR